MRSRWEERELAEAKMDEPVTITERQLRTLTLGARAGLFAILLAVAATGLATWSLLRGPRESAAPPQTASASMTDTGVAQAAPSPAVTPAGTPAAAAAQPVASATQAAQQTAPVTPAVKPTATAAKTTVARVKTPRASKPARGSVETPVSMPATSLTPDPTPAPAGITPVAPSTSKPDSAR